MQVDKAKMKHNLIPYLLMFILVFCSILLVNFRSQAQEDSFKSCNELFISLFKGDDYSNKFKIISGGFQDTKARIGVDGESGGAYRAKIKVGQKIINAVEKRILPDELLAFTDEEHKHFLDLSSEIATLAGEKGLGPKVFGFRDSILGGKKVRFLYMDEVGREGISIPNPHSSSSRVHMLRDFKTMINYKEAKDLYGDKVLLKVDGFLRAAIMFILSEEKLDILANRLELIKAFHPDYHGKNILLEFYYNRGELDARAVGVDWDHPCKSIAMLQDIVKKLKKYNPEN